MGGGAYHFAITGTYFRPLTSLTYAFEYSIWGLNPFGYHLFDLLLQLAMSVFAFFFILKLTKGRLLVGWIGAVIISIHPVLMESLPTPERLNDILATLLLLGSFYSLIRYVESGRWRFINISAGCYFLSLMTKEISVIFVPLAISYLMIFRFPEVSLRGRAIRAIKACSPFLAATAAMALWRWLVLHGALGNFSAYYHGISGYATFYNGLLRHYVTDLIAPGGIAGYYDPQPGTRSYMLAIVLLLLLFIVMFSYRRELSNLFKNEGTRQKAIAYAVGSITIISLIALSAYPFFAHFISVAVQHQGSGNSLVSKLWRVPSDVPLSLALYRIRNQNITLLSFLLFASAGALLINHWRKAVIKYLTATESGRLIFFLLIWLVLPLCLYAVTASFMHWYMYGPLVPFSIILAVVIADGAALLAKKVKTEGREAPAIVFRQWKNLLGGAIIGVVVLSLSFIPISPLFKHYGEWEENGKIFASIFDQMASYSASLPKGSTIGINDLPNGIGSFEETFGHPQSVQYVRDEGIKAWFDMKFPGKDFAVIVEKRTPFIEPPHLLNLRIVQIDSLKYQVIIDYFPGQPTGRPIE